MAHRLLILAAATTAVVAFTAPVLPPCASSSTCIRMMSAEPEDRAQVAADSIQAAVLAAEKSDAICSAADTLIRACLGFDRGVSASPSDASNVNRAIEAFEAAAAPSALDPMVERLEGEWRLMWSSSLVEDRKGGLPSAQDLARYVVTVVDAPTARSRVAIGEVSQTIRAARVEERVALRLRVPWPLPAAPELQMSLTSALESTSDGQLRCTLQSVEARLEGAAPLSLPLGQLHEALPAVLPEPLAALPFASDVARAVEDARLGSVTALGGGLRVDRSRLGEVRVYVMQSPSESREDGRGVGVAALEEVAQLRLAVGEAQEALKTFKEQAADSTRVMEAAHAQAIQVAEAEHAAALAAAAAELGEAMAAANDKLAAAMVEAAADRAAMAAEHTRVLDAAKAKAAEEIASSEREMAMVKARAEQEASAAKATHLAEKQALSVRLMEAEDRAAKAKAAAQAAIGDL